MTKQLLVSGGSLDFRILAPAHCRFAAISQPPPGALPTSGDALRRTVPRGERGWPNPSRPAAFDVTVPTPASRPNADDRLSRAPLAGVEGGDCIIEGCDIADVGAQSPVPHALDDLVQLRPIRLDDEIDCQTFRGSRLNRADDRHQRSSSPDQACGSLLDVTADEIENQVDTADVFQPVIREVDKLLCAKVDRLLAVGGASGADDVCAGFAGQLRHHRSNRAGRAVRKDGLPRLEAPVLEQALPGRKP